MTNIYSIWVRIQQAKTDLERLTLDSMVKEWDEDHDDPFQIEAMDSHIRSFEAKIEALVREQKSQRFIDPLQVDLKALTSIKA